MRMPKSLRIAAGVLAGALTTFSLSAAAPVFAADAPTSGSDTVVIRKVDTSDLPNVSLTVLKPPVASSNADVVVKENGVVVPPSSLNVKTAEQADLPMSVVIVVDTSKGAADNQNAFESEKQAALQMIDARIPGEQFAVLATGGLGSTVSTFSSDTDALKATIGDLNAGQSQNTIWSSVTAGASLLSKQTGTQHNLVLMTANKDSGQVDGGYKAAASALRENKVSAFTVALGTNVDSDNLKDLAASTGGRYLSTTNPDSAVELAAGIQGELANQAVITYKTKDTKDAINISVAVGKAIASTNASPNTIAEGDAVTPAIIKQNGGPSFLNSSLGLLLVAVVSLLAVGLLLFGVVEILGHEKRSLTSALRPYAEGRVSDDDRPRDISRLADSEIIKKTVAAVGRSAEDRGILEPVRKRLEQADLPVHPAEALVGVGVVALFAMLIGAIFFSIIGIVIAAFVFGLGPIWATGFLAKRRRKKFNGQLPDTLQLMAGSLRAGYSLLQGLDAVCKQTEAPMGPELTRALSEARLGRPVEEALQEVSDRMGSDDFEWAVMAIKIQREVGGNLAELLMTVSETMVARERLRREVLALTAEGRISAIVLVALPVVVAIAISFINPGYIKPMTDVWYGQAALGAGVFMLGIGYWLMMKMIQVEA